jgi:hypothetical protein
MSSLSQFGGQRATRSITNGWSTSGWAGLANAAVLGGRSLDSGSTTANTLKTIFSATGGGVIHGLIARSNNATSRTIRARLTLDGVVVFDSTSAAIASANAGGIVVGGWSSASGLHAPTVAVFASTATFEIASSLTETDGIQTQYIIFGN